MTTVAVRVLMAVVATAVPVGAVLPAHPGRGLVDVRQRDPVAMPGADIAVVRP